MPRYLRSSAVRLLESSMEALSLAITGLGIPIRNALRVPSSQYAAVIGLLGTSAEQALGAIQVQVEGDEALMQSASQYKSARQTLEDVRSLLRNPVPRASFLTVGKDDSAAHRERLLNATDVFSLLLTERAAGLHSGQGPSREVTLIACQRVHQFLRLLAESSRIRPYMAAIPNPPGAILEPQVIVEDLIRKFQETHTTVERATILRSLFLVLPETPSIEPAWLQAFDRATVSPTTDDINVLLTTLENATPIRLQRINPAGNGLSVIVRPGDPDALPISPQHLRRAFEDIADQWAADVGNANGRLTNGRLDLPPDDFVLDLCILGPRQILNLLGREQIFAQDAWPFIAAALDQIGTPRPFWFLVRMTEDLGQLRGQLNRVFDISTRTRFRSQKIEVLQAIDSIRTATTLPRESNIAIETRLAYALASEGRARLIIAAERSEGSTRQLSYEADLALRSIVDDELAIGEHFLTILSGVSGIAKPYWARLLAEAAGDPEDVTFLVGIINDNTLIQAQTAARKALRLIDTLSYGPEIEIE